MSSPPSPTSSGRASPSPQASSAPQTPPQAAAADPDDEDYTIDQSDPAEGNDVDTVLTTVAILRKLVFIKEQMDCAFWVCLCYICKSTASSMASDWNAVEHDADSLFVQVAVVLFENALILCVITECSRLCLSDSEAGKDLRSSLRLASFTTTGVRIVMLLVQSFDGDAIGLRHAVYLILVGFSLPFIFMFGHINTSHHFGFQQPAAMALTLHIIFLAVILWIVGTCYQVGIVNLPWYLGLLFSISQILLIELTLQRPEMLEAHLFQFSQSASYTTWYYLSVLAIAGFIISGQMGWTDMLSQLASRWLGSDDSGSGDDSK
jgi:hypothetical protein